MPMTRFEIRNEFSLADSELYRAADKDDPEALLEGVAMAGLVGVLRQLGDLAEFAADIFHNLHEEVMVTAARGHSLMTRVRQLETEVPSIETAFLSQTDHSSFMYHAGVDWHPNLRTDTNLVTRIDLPRFVMDSYEECKAPPRLFLLDKFDIAGAGACLKRYTDPSFFKVETTDMTNADVQRERKILKLKKKGQGPRGRNGEMTEPSNTKLHQLFTEEHTENGVNNHLRRVKLKRRLNGFPLDSKTGGSYMKKILKSPSPDHKVLHEVDVYPLTALMPARSDENESGLEAPQVRPASPDRVSIERDRSLHPSPDRKEILLNPSLCEPAEATADDQIGDVSNSFHHFVTGGTSSTHDEVTAEKVIAIDADSNSEGSLTDYESNVVASEGETYMDATSVMEPEMDTEPEFTMKNDPTTLHTKSRSSISDANEEHDSTWISDCQSSGESLLSDEGNNSSRKEMSGCSPSDSANRISSADTPEMETVASLPFQDDADKGFMVDQLSQTVVSTDGMNCHTSDFEQQQTNLCINESVPTLVHLESEVIEIQNKSKQLEDDEISSTSHDDEKKTNIVSDQPCYPFDSDFESHSRDNAAGLSAGKHLVIEAKEASKQPMYDERASMQDEDEKKTHVVRDLASYLVVSDYELYCRDNSAVLSAGQYLVNEAKDEMVPFTSTVPDIDRPITDSSATSLDLLHEDDANEQDQYLVENEASTSNMFNVLSESRNDAPEMIPTTCPIPGESGDESPKLIENLSSDYSDIPHNEDVSKPTVSQEENLLCELDSEDSNASTHAPSHSSGLLEVPSGQKLNGTSLVSSQTVNFEENCSNGSVENLITSEKLMMLHLANSPDRPQDLDADEEDVIDEQGTMGNGTLALESPTSGEIVGFSVEVITDCVFPGEPAETSDTVERDEINLHKSSITEVTGISGSTDLKPPNEPDSGEGISNVETASSVCVLTDDTVADDAHSNMDLKKVAEHVHPEGSGLDELENYESSLSVSHQEFAGLVEKAVQIEAAASDSEPVFCNSVSDRYPKLEVSDSVPDSHLALEVDNRWESVDCITIHPILEPRGSSAEDEFFRQSGLGNDVPDAKSFCVDHNTEESKTKGKTELPPNELDQELSQSSEISSELPFLLSISQQKLQGHDDQKGENYSSPIVSLAGCPNPFSISELQRQSGCDVGVSGYPKAPFGSIFSLNNPFTERNQIELPPLPPLPPVQWRMGKSQQDSAPTEEGMIKHKELSPELVGPMNPSTDDVCFSRLNSFTDDVKIVPPTASVADVNTFPQIASSTDDIKNFSLMVSSDDAVASPQTVSSADDVKTFPPTASAADVNTSPQIVSSADEIKKFPLTASSDDVVTSPRTASSTDDIKTFPPTASAADVNTSLQIASSTDEIKFPLMASSDNVVTSPRTALPIDDVKTLSPTASAADVNTSPQIALSTDDIKTFLPTASTAEDAKVFPLIASADDVSNSPKVVSSTDDVSSSPLMPSNNYVSLPLEEATHCPIQTALMPESKEETAESKCSTQEMKDTQEPANIVLNIEEQKQQQSTVPTPKGEFKSPEEDDGFSHESRTVKQPYPRNPLVDEVATLKLRKVTDRDRPQIQKGDERDAFLEQIRNKSFHLKPTMAPRPTIQHPKTNIRVAAILEKANAIRQALAGSDEEDDDDCWSDS